MTFQETPVAKSMGTSTIQVVEEGKSVTVKPKLISKGRRRKMIEEIKSQCSSALEFDIDNRRKSNPVVDSDELP